MAWALAGVRHVIFDLRARVGPVPDLLLSCSRYFRGSERAKHRSLHAISVLFDGREWPGIHKQARLCVTLVGGTPVTANIELSRTPKQEWRLEI